MRLEVGSGGGTWRFRPSFEGEDVVFVDVERPKMNIARSRNFVVGDINNLPFKEEAFHKVACSHVLEQNVMKDPLHALIECRSVLSAEGEIHVWTPNFLHADITASHLHVFTFWSLRSLLREAGFKPHFFANVGTRLPKITRMLITILVLLLGDSLYLRGLKLTSQP